MTVEELITELQKLPKDFSIKLCVYKDDWTLVREEGSLESIINEPDHQIVVLST